jgi:hypothetical protein
LYLLVRNCVCAERLVVVKVVWKFEMRIMDPGLPR